MSVSISYGAIYIVKTEYYNNQPVKEKQYDNN